MSVEREKTLWRIELAKKKNYSPRKCKAQAVTIWCHLHNNQGEVVCKRTKKTRGRKKGIKKEIP